MSGSLTGKIDDSELNSQLQSYVVLSDGRSYTAVSPLNSDVGYNSQLAYTFGYAIGWLFAKPVGSDAPNGYEVSYDFNFFHFNHSQNYNTIISDNWW